MAGTWRTGSGALLRALLVFLSVNAAAACGRVLIRSQPPGAAIFIDGKDTGLTTPAKISPSDVKHGRHKIAVRAAGYQTPPPETVRKSFSVGRVVGSFFLPVPFLIINIARGWFDLEPDDIFFQLNPGPSSVTSAPPAPRAPTAPPAQPAQPARRTEALSPLNVPAGRFGKMAVIPTQFDESSRGQVPDLFDDYLLSAVQNTANAEVIGQDDISALLGFEKEKDMLDCSDTSCIADIGGALGVDRIVVVKIARLEDQWVATAKIIDIKNTRVEARVNDMITGNVKLLLEGTGRLVHDLFAAALARPAQ